MDRGAHFHRCDFQVHTPRDTNWTGERPVTEDDRKDFAQRFVRACREKGLNAVAITDHHDIGFFRYIKAAAQSEQDEDGQLIPEESRLVVLPGMELTLGIACQALLLLDADFPEEFLGQVPTALSITCNSAAEPTHAPVSRLDHFTDFSTLHDRLDELSYLKGRYIVLPNVSRRGASTLQRQGFSAHYRQMPCVGGYLDHSVDQLGVGDRSILEGRVAEYGRKPLGVFPTSDSRDASFSDLGRHSVWIKWARPTAEAIRQACLARKTRILHSPPELPALVIESLHVSLSKFLGPVDLELNPQFTCLIGGRGTGKSTILEYLRWGLCDQPPRLLGAEDVPDFQAKRSALIDTTLLPHKGVVSVNFSVNGVRHIVRRRSDPAAIELKVGDEPFKSVREQDVRDLLPLQAYSQKQLSAVGVRAEELLRFVQAPIARRLGELSALAEDCIAEIRSNYMLVIRKRRLAAEIARQEVELASLEQQSETLRAGLKGLTTEEQDILKRQERYAVEQATFDQWDRDRERAVEAIRKALADIERLPSRGNVDTTLPNSELLTESESLLSAAFDRSRQLLRDAGNVISGSEDGGDRLVNLRRTWDVRREAQAVAYASVRQAAIAHEAVLKQIAEIDARIGALRGTVSERRASLDGLGTPETSYERARERWLALFRERGEMLQARCEELTGLSRGSIRASMLRGAGVQRVSERMTALVEGTGIKGQSKKIDDLCESISTSSSSVSQWESILKELQALSDLEVENVAAVAVPGSPALSTAGFNKQDIERLAQKLRPEDWIDVALIELDDIPVFEYMLAEGEYIPFANASAGQQATALLKVLLNQHGPPLIIDQPEEDLDNQVILNVVEEIWNAKRNRQIVFSSHNANIVVNGDADLVVCCDYRTTGDQSGGRIKCEGAIDIDQVKKEITTIMEGGRAAFQMRRDKYGF